MNRLNVNGIHHHPSSPQKRCTLLSLGHISCESTTSSLAEPSWLLKLTETWEKVIIMSAESSQQLCEIQSLQEMLNCIICKSTMKATTNLLVAPRCQATLACRECMEEWFCTSNNHSCPNCRAVCLSFALLLLSQP